MIKIKCLIFIYYVVAFFSTFSMDTCSDEMWLVSMILGGNTQLISDRDDSTCQIIDVAAQASLTYATAMFVDKSIHMVM